MTPALYAGVRIIYLGDGAKDEGGKKVRRRTKT